MSKALSKGWRGPFGTPWMVRLALERVQCRQLDFSLFMHFHSNKYPKYKQFTQQIHVS
ncbi:hypothetical protein [Rhodoferax sp. TH121]|uniref:hypothetical protein n=1 Tax=Rhodoferax sp. TH121 TaxID=2022803 RepID=UPI0015957A5C|nr:hypothetical protein [Rhodoferax sp. TH121]